MQSTAPAGSATAYLCTSNIIILMSLFTGKAAHYAADRSVLKRFPTSVWVLVGYAFWFGFFLGALIMHSIIKSV